MKLKLGKPPKSIPLLISFLLPFAIYTCIMCLGTFAPFGDRLPLRSDAYHQYYPFYLQFREAIRSGESLQWTWSVGAGMDYVGMTAYYTASPLCLLSALLPDAMATPFYFLLTPIKLSFASLFMALLLTRLYDQRNYTVPLFACAYAFCGWAMGYCWNIMWLDGFALLPLAIWGMMALLRSGKPTVYVLALTLVLVSNYYIAFFICIFIFLLFFCYEFCQWRGAKALLVDLCHIALCTVAAFGLSAFMLLPAYGALQKTYAAGGGYNASTVIETYILSEADQAKITKLWESYKNAAAYKHFAPVEWLKAAFYSVPLFVQGTFQILGNAFCGTNPTILEGLPNVYSGTVVLFLAILYFFGKIPWREKVCSAALLLFLLLGMTSNRLTWLLHGCHFPAQIPFRFAFLFSFVVILMAYRVWLQIRTIAPWKTLLSGGITAALLLLGNSLTDSWLRFNLIFLAISAAAIIAHYARKVKTAVPTQTPPQEGEAEHITVPIPATGETEHMAVSAPATGEARNTNSTSEASETYANGDPGAAEEIPPQKSENGAASGKPKARQRVAAFVLGLCLLTELVISPLLSLATISYLDEAYAEPLYYTPAITKLLATDDRKDLFYRTEFTPMTTFNDGALYGYNSISAFSSTINANNTSFILALGGDCSVKNNRTYYGHGSPVSSLFLNLKYLIATNGAAGNDPFFDTVAQEGELTPSQNNAYLPLGFMVGEAMTDLLFAADNGSSFDFQNNLFSAATGLDEKVWTKIDAKTWTYSGTDNVTIIPKSSPGKVFAKSTNLEEGTLSCTYIAEYTGVLTLHIDSFSDDNTYSVYRNDKLLFTDHLNETQQTITIGSVETGDLIRVDIPCPAQNEENTKSTLVRITGAILDEQIFRQGYEILSSSVLTITDFSNTYVCGTISGNGGLMYTSIPQDGNWTAYVDGKKAEPVLIGNCMIALHLEAGSHTIEFRYRNKAFTLGCIISATTASAVLAFILFRMTKQKEKPATLDNGSTVPSAEREGEAQNAGEDIPGHTC